MNSRFLLFSASAGSGKTYNLAVQYIALLAARGEHEFSHTLAVTFTNKATAEMKDRILEQLYGISMGLKKSNGYLCDVQKELNENYDVHISDKEVRQRCRKALKCILHDYGRFYVSTIDAFFQTVLRNMAHELGLNARLQVEIGDKDVIEMAVDNIISGLQHTEKDIRPWIQAYIDQQIQEGKRWDIRDNLKSLAQMLFQEEYLKRVLDPANKAFTPKNIENYRKALKEEQNIVIKPCQKAAETVIGILTDNCIDYEDLSNGNVLRNYVETLRAGDMGANFGSTLEKKVNDPSLFLRSEDRKKSEVLFPQLKQLAEALDHLRHAQEKAIPVVNTTTQAMKHLSPMGLLGAIDEEVKRINNENNRFSLAHTPILIRQMIQEDDAPFIFEKIGTRFGNIMIDEFQDTSTLQWENFKVLLMNNLAQGGLSMIVGDIKQSIYRWRNGDWHILHQLEQQGLTGFTTDNRPLNTNFRSKGEIVKFNNDFFSRAAEKLDELNPNSPTPLSGLYANVRQQIKPGYEKGGYVRIRIHEEKEECIDWQEEMLREMSEQIELLHTKYKIPYRKMAILIRKSKFIEPMINYFAQNMSQVRLVSDEAFCLRYSLAVNMIVNALEVLCEYSSANPNPVPLRYLIKHYKQDILGQELSPLELYTSLPDESLPQEITLEYEKLRSLPLYELCEKLYRIFSLQKLQQQDAYLLCFFDELTSYLRDNPSDIPAFLQYWEESMGDKTIPSGEVDGIRIITIHSSKGLQFHTVLMPYCEGTIEKDRPDGILWCHPTEVPTNQLGSLPVPTSGKLKDTDFAPEYEKEHDNRRADELNVLYVAFTRAEQNLLVWGEKKGEIEVGKSDETIGDLIAACVELDKGVFTQGELSVYKEKEEDSEASENRIHPDYTSSHISMCSHEGKMEFRQSRPAAEFIHVNTDDEPIDEKQLNYIEKGKLLHYIFSQIERSDEVERVAQEMVERGILSSSRQRDEVVSLARRGLKQQKVSDWFSGKYKLFNERSILNIKDGEVIKRRPDRVMVSDERIIIVDFKFGKPQPEHHEQVKEYINILQDMHADKQIEGYLWYVYKNKVERI